MSAQAGVGGYERGWDDALKAADERIRSMRGRWWTRYLPDGHWEAYWRGARHARAVVAATRSAGPAPERTPDE